MLTKQAVTRYIASNKSLPSQQRQNKKEAEKKHTKERWNIVK